MNIKLGHKAGSGSQRKPVTAPDSSSSKSYARIVYGINDGHMVGFIDGLKSLILDNTPVQSSSGEMNITEVEVQTRWGTNDQDYLEGFPSVVNEIGYSNVEIVSDHNFVHYVNDLNTNAVGIRFTWGKIFRQNESNGDINGYRIDYAIDVQTDGNGFVEVLKTSLNDKTSSGYERYHRLELPPAEVGWEIRVRRLTANATSDFIGDKMFLSAVAEIVDAKLRYPNTALIALKFDADKFGSIPKADFRLRGKIIKVPTNYNPETRTYAVTEEGTTNGIWDGSFKLAYTNNPVWIFYDLLLSKRYGLGERLDASMVDKWALYSIGQYCDVMVPDGMGGTEPRLTCNVYINSKYEAFDLLMQLASTFRGILHWDGASIVATADRPSDPVFTFTRANIIGEFNYSGTRARDRSSMISVAFDDPANNYKTDKEVVSDTNAIAEVGVRLKELTAFGCTSRGQAQRIGRLGLLKEQQELRMVTFTVGLDGYIPVTGKIIEIADPLLAGRAIGGRISVVSADGLVITLDREVTANAGDVLVANGDDGIQQRRDITNVTGNTVTVSAAFTGVSAENVWAIDSEDLSLMRFRVLSVAQNRSDDGLITFTISGVQHNPTIDEGADFSAYIEQPTYSNIEIYTQVAPTELVIGSENVINQGLDITNVVFSWPQAVNAVKYELEWRRDNGSWIKAPIIYSNTFVVEDVYHGLYEARIVAINAMDVRSLYTLAQPTIINSKFAEPPMLSFIQATGIQFGAEISWVFPARESQNAEYVEVQISYRSDKTDAKLLGNYAYPLNRAEINGLQANLKLWVKARIIDRNKVEGPWTIWVSTTTDADASILLDALNGKITSSQLDQDLNQSIILGSGAAQTAEAAQNAANAAALAATNAQAAADQAHAAAGQVQAQVTATTAELRGLLNTTADGLTQEILDRQEGDADVVGQLTTYKTSNDAAMSAVQQQVEAATSASSANATALTNLNTEVVAAHNLASNALQQAQSATDATSTNASNLIALNSRMATAEQDINGVKTSKLDASVIQQYRTAVDQDSATASSLTALRAQLAAGARNFVRGTKEPAQGFHWLYQRPLTAKLTGIFTISFDVEALDDTPVSGSGADVGFNMGDGGTGGFNYVWYPNLAMKGHLTHTLTLDSGDFTHFGIYANNTVKITNVMVQRGDVDYPWAAAPEDNEAAIAANAQAIRNTETAIATVDGKVTAQATDILNLNTNLTNLNNTKLDASIIQQYRTAIDQDNVTAGELTQFKSTLKVGGVNVLLNSREPRSGVNEYLMYECTTELKDFYDQNLNKDVTVSCEILVPVAGNVKIYTSNSSAHYFEHTTLLPANQWTRIVATVKPVPHDTNPDWATSSLEFYGEYGTGRIVTVRNVQLEAGNFATDWSPSPRDYAEDAENVASALSETNTRVGSVENGIASQANQLTSLSAKLNARKVYQLYSGGLEAVTGGMGRIEGFDPSSYYTIGRSYGLVVFNGDGSIQSVNSYDVFGGHTQGFIDAVSAVPTGTYAAVLTSDEPQSNSANIKEALKSLGGSDALDQLVHRGAYLLVGRKGLPSGQAIEKISNTPTFGVDYLLEMYNGVPIGLGGSSPQSDIVSNMRTEVSNIGGNITSLSETVTQHTASLTNLSLGGFNLLYNGDFSTNSYSGWNFTAHITPAENIAVLNRNGGLLSDWALDADPSRTLAINTQGAYPVDGHQYIDAYQKIAVSGDSFYQLSAYVAPHRSKAIVYATFFNHLGEVIGYSTVGVEPNSVCSQPGAGSLGGKLLQNYRRIHINTKTPPDTAYLYFNIRFVSFDGAYLFMTRTMCCQVSALNAPLMPWNEGSSAAANVSSTSLAKVTEVDGKVTSLAEQTSTLSTTVGSNTAAIQLQQSSIDGINAKATLQVEAGGTIGGVALGNNGGVVDFLIRADTFAIAPPVGYSGSNKYLMTYRATPVTLPNGRVVSEGLYLNNLVVDYIDASKIYATSLSAISANLGTIKVGSANIANLAVDTLHIKDNAVTVPAATTLLTQIKRTTNRQPTTFAGGVTALVDASNYFGDILSLTIDRKGGKCRVEGSIWMDKIYGLLSNSSGSIIPTGEQYIGVMVFKNGKLLSWARVPTSFKDTNQAREHSGVAAIPVVIDAPGVGLTTYSIRLGLTSDRTNSGTMMGVFSGSPTIVSATLAVMELKK